MTKALRSLGLIFALAFGVHAVFAAPSNQRADNRLPVKDVHRFTKALSQVKSYYVEDVKDEKLFDNAIRGMLSGLDPHSAYLNKQEYKDLKVSTNGEYGGLGIEITMDNKRGLIKVVSPIDDTPAAAAKLMPGDYIYKIDGKPVKGMTLRKAVDMMRGKPNTKVTLSILREKAKKNPIKKVLTRAKIQIRTVKSKLYDGNYGYIRISHFQAPTAEAMEKAVAKLQKQTKGKLKGLVLDLRNNPGGLLDSAIRISDAFIHNDQKGKDELIVFTKGRVPGTRFSASANPGDLIKGAPIVVLINEGSASGSEIVAGALQDHKRAIVIGKKSFGKGSVQTVFPLDDNSAVKITTARYYTPNGRSIQAKGIEPDLVVEQLKIAKVESDAAALEGMSEATLSGHLEHEGAQAKANTKKAEKTSKDLAKKDYQLYEALNFLKAFNVLQAHGKTA